jgi:hypothetical protein
MISSFLHLCHNPGSLLAFAHQQSSRCSRAATASTFVHRRELSPSLRTNPRVEFDYEEVSMRPLKSIAALASAAAITCLMFVFGWVGLALLGF